MDTFLTPQQVRAADFPLLALGRRLRTARRLRRLSQEALTTPFLPVHFVRAVERGRLLPSRAALALLAARLQLPPADLIGDLPEGVAGSDLRAMEADVVYQIQVARDAIELGPPAEGLQRLTALEGAYQAYWDCFSPYTRYGFYYARAAGYSYQGLPEAARADLAQAALLAGQIRGGEQLAEQARNARGATYYQQEQPGEALAHYNRCLCAIHRGIVPDLNLRLAIYTNLAHAYRALHQPATAVRIYRDALAMLREVSNWRQQVAVCAGMSLAYQALGEPDQARLYALRALWVYENRAAVAGAVQGTEPRPLREADRIAHALLQIHLADLRLAQQEWAAATALLDQARAGLEAIPGSGALLGCVYAHLAQAHLDSGDLSTAAVWASRSVGRIGTICADVPASAPPHTLHRAHAHALQVAGLVAERQAQPAQSDAWFHQALALVEQNGPRETVHEVLFTYAEILNARGAHEEAVRYYQAAVRQPRPRPTPCSVLDACGRAFGWPLAAL